MRARTLSLVGLSLFVLISGADSSWATSGTLECGPAETSWEVQDDCSSDAAYSGSTTCPGDGTRGTVTDAEFGDASDAFDYAYQFFVDGVPFGAPATIGTCEYSAGPVNLSGLNVSLHYFASSTDAILRVRQIFSNPTSAPIGVTVETPVNFGSDSGTINEATSDGDSTVELSDRWLISSDGSPSDPVNTTVWLGPGSPASTPSFVTTSVFNSSAENGLGVTFQITIPANSTRSLMWFAALGDHVSSNTIAGAIAAATRFDSSATLGGDLLSGLTPLDLSQTLNWDFTPEPDLFSTHSSHYAGPTLLQQQDVHGQSASGGTLSLKASFLSPWVGLDALEALGDGKLWFSTVNDGVVDGLLLQHESAYRYDPATDTIDPTPVMDGSSLGLRSLDALADVASPPDNRIAFSVAYDQSGPTLKQQNLYLFTPPSTITLGINLAARGLQSLDALDLVPGPSALTQPIVSTAANQFLSTPSGTVFVSQRNAYQLDLTSTPATVTTALSGAFVDLDAVSLTRGVFPEICQGQYTVEAISFAPVAGSGTDVFLSDDEVSGALPIGFDFRFFCSTYTTFYISSNGFITFTDDPDEDGCCGGDQLPNTDAPNNLIAAAWDDLYPPGAGSITYFTTGSAPARRLVVNFTDLPFCCDEIPKVTTQIVLYESSNVIEIHSTSIDGISPGTQGLESPSGTAAFPVAGRNGEAWSATTDAVRFTP